MLVQASFDAYELRVLTRFPSRSSNSIIYNDLHYNLNLLMLYEIAIAELIRLET